MQLRPAVCPSFFWLFHRRVRWRKWRSGVGKSHKEDAEAGPDSGSQGDGGERGEAEGRGAAPETLAGASGPSLTHGNFTRMPLFCGNSDTRYRRWVSGWAAMRWRTPDAFWHWHLTPVSHKHTCKDTLKRCQHDQMLFPFMHFSSGLWGSGFHLRVWDWSSRSEVRHEHETRGGR